MKKILALALALLMVLAFAACGDKAEAPVDEAPVDEAPAVEEVTGDASGEMASGEMGEASGEASGEIEAPAEGDASGEPAGQPSGEPMPAAGEIEITVDGVTGMAAFEESDNGDMATKGLTVTFDGQTYTGGIDKGVYTADDAAAQPIFTALQEARAATGAGQPSGEPSGEPQA